MAIKISLQHCQIIAPNCGGADTLTVLFTLEDAQGNEATASIIGAKNAFNNISDTQYLVLDGNNSSSNYTNAFGTLNIDSNYPSNFEIDEVISVKMDVEDCKGWQNMSPAIGFTNAVMTAENNFLMDENGNYLAFL